MVDHPIRSALSAGCQRVPGPRAGGHDSEVSQGDIPQDQQIKTLIGDDPREPQILLLLGFQVFGLIDI